MNNRSPRRIAIVVTVVTVLGVILGGASGPPNLDRALDAQRGLVETQPSDSRALNDLGNLLLLAGDTHGAEAAYSRALGHDPHLVSARYNLGLLEMQRGEERQAIATFERVLDVHPDHAWSHFQIGVLYERSGKDKAAVSAYARAFSVDPDLSFASVNPQILDSRLVTNALIEMSKVRTDGADAPRRYEEPARIAALLLPSVPASDEAAAAAEPGPSVAPAGMGTVTPINPLPPIGGGTTLIEPTPDSGGHGTRVLDSSDLGRSGSVGGGRVGGGRVGGFVGGVPRGGSSVGSSGARQIDTTAGRSGADRTRTGRPTQVGGSIGTGRNNSGQDGLLTSTASTGRNSGRVDG